jgi:hypothetical protein
MILGMRIKGVASAVAVAASSLALIPAGAPAARAQEANSHLAETACFLLPQTGLPHEINGGHPEEGGPAGNACADGSCWTTEVDPEGIKQCTYGRSALLTLGRSSRPSAAQAFVRGLYAKGYKKVSIKHAALAALVSDPSGGGVVMAVGSTTAVLAIGAKGPHETHVPWAGSKAILLHAAKQLAARLSKPGCPLSEHACF